MIKPIILFALSFCLCVLGVNVAQAAQGDYYQPPVLVRPNMDFRSFVWGVDAKTVRANETAIFDKEDDNSLSYLEQVKGEGVLRRITYRFENGRLISGEYAFVDLAPPRPQPAIDLYEAMKRHVTKAVEKGYEENLRWKNRYYQRRPEFWGRAIASGDLSFQAVWQYNRQTVARLDFQGVEPYYVLTFTAEQKDHTKEPAQDLLVPHQTPQRLFLNP